MRPVMALVTAAGLGLMAALPAMAQTAPTQTGPLLSLSAEGQVKATPDVAFVTFGLVTEAKTAQEAMAANAAQMSRVMSTLKAQGIADKHVQTSGLSLNAQYDYRDNQPPVLRGYQASNQVSVRIEDLAKTGATLDAVVKAGVNQINGISFGLKDPKKAEDAARLDAVKALQAKANLYAGATGYRIKGLQSLSEGGGFAPMPMPMPMPRMMKAEMAMADATPVAAGEMAVSITISAIYELEK